MLRDKNPMSEQLLAEAVALGIDVDGLVKTVTEKSESKFDIEDKIYDGVYRARYLRFFTQIIEKSSKGI